MTIGPRKSAKIKLDQLIVLQSLCELYGAKKLRKYLLSMYLKLTTEYRLKTIDDLEWFWRGELEDTQQIPTRLM